MNLKVRFSEARDCCIMRSAFAGECKMTSFDMVCEQAADKPLPALLDISTGLDKTAAVLKEATWTS
jgi:hypothetical protein